MYIPDAFRVEDAETMFAFIDAHPFATLVSVLEGKPFASHLPLLLDRESGVLLGHVARPNPHASAFDGSSAALAIFHGPHAYVSPTWYVAPGVPTWNYAAVHVAGCPRRVEEGERLAEVVARLTARFEGEDSPIVAALRGTGAPPPGLDPHKLLKGIVGFEMKIERIEGKFKLGQNRSAADREKMLGHLSHGNAEARTLADFIRENEQPPPPPFSANANPSLKNSG